MDYLLVVELEVLLHASINIHTHSLFAVRVSSCNSDHFILACIYSCIASAINGDIEKDSVLLRVGAGYGQYNYATPGVAENSVTGAVSSYDLMVGYQKYFSLGRVTAYTGANYDNYDLSPNDSANRVNGGKKGAKGQIELTLNPAKNISFNNISSYSTAYRNYWTRTILGLNCGNFIVGPEAIFLGNTSFNQKRFGLNFSEIDLGFAKGSLSGG